MLRRKAGLLAVALVACVACASAASACSDDPMDTAPGADGGGGETGVVVAVCPEVAPSPSAPCAAPEGTTCAFGACGTPIAQCLSGRWRFAANEPPKPPCPIATPESDSPCPACWPASSVCRYGSVDCTAPDASVNTAHASCPAGVWVVEFRPCRDAGADVQGDAGADGD